MCPHENKTLLNVNHKKCSPVSVVLLKILLGNAQLKLTGANFLNAQRFFGASLYCGGST